MSDIKEIDLEEIKRWLIRGDHLKIEKKTGVNRSHICNILNGKTRKVNFEVIDAAAEIAIERKSRVINKMDRLKQIR